MIRITLALALLVAPTALADVIAPFDDYPLAPNSYYNGADFAGGFTSNSVFFNNSYTVYPWGAAWNGWSVSNMTDTTTAGFTNQFSAWTGTGYNSANYGVAFGNSARIDLPIATTVTGTYLTNTTYAALSMRNGDFFNEKFGGPDGTEPDWFYVKITGVDAMGQTTGDVTFYLADFRFENSADDYILNQWTWVDLSSLGVVKQLKLSFDGSNVDQYGLTIPTYVAMDDLAVNAIPEPASLMLLAGATLAIRRR